MRAVLTDEEKFDEAIRNIKRASCLLAHCDDEKVQRAREKLATALEKLGEDFE